MLDYEWGNAASILLPGEDPTSDSDQTRPIFDPYNQTLSGNLLQPAVGFSSHPFQQQQIQAPLQSFDTRAYPFSYPRPPVSPSPAAVRFSPRQHLPVVGPKTEDFSGSRGEFPARIGLNLGVRTYFSSAEDDFVSRLYRRSRTAEPCPTNSPRCQAEGCNADLTHAKHYHRRHKVCEFHSKASTVLAAGLTQRFCQQCSRFHLLSEFDQGKRSCRKRLADHNRRRRKSQPQQLQSQSESVTTSLARVETPSKSSPESGTPSSSTVSMAISPPQIAFDCFQLTAMTTHKASASPSSSNSRFSPRGISFSTSVGSGTKMKKDSRRRRVEPIRFFLFLPICLGFFCF